MLVYYSITIYCTVLVHWNYHSLLPYPSSLFNHNLRSYPIPLSHHSLPSYPSLHVPPIILVHCPIIMYHAILAYYSAITNYPQSLVSYLRSVTYLLFQFTDPHSFAVPSTILFQYPTCPY